MTNLRRIALAAATALVAAGFQVAAQPPASAVLSDCPAQHFCLWGNINYVDPRFQWSQTTFNIAPHTNISLGSGVANRGYSFYNRTSHAVFLYDSPHCSTAGWWRELYPGGRATAQNSDWGGRVSSIGQGQGYNRPC